MEGKSYTASFTGDQLERLFPFYLLLDRNLCIRAIGPSVQKLFGDLRGVLLAEAFRLNNVIIHRRSKVFFDCAGNSGTLTWRRSGRTLQGQFERVGADELLFVGTPAIQSLDDLAHTGLAATDFAEYDNTVALMEHLKLQENRNQDLQQLLETVRVQKKDLQRAVIELKEMALMGIQNPDPQLRVGFDGRILMMNPAAETLKTYRYDGQIFTAAGFWEHMAAARQAGKDTMTFEAEVDGKIYSFICRCQDKYAYANIYGRDVTKRRSSEQALRVNEEKYRSIISNMNLGLLEVDTEEIITYANQSFCVLSGYSAGELIGKKASELLTREESSPVITHQNKKREQGIADAYEILVHNKRGGSQWWLVSGAPRYNDAGEFVGSIGIHLDITDRKKLEVQLIEARDRAEHLAKTRELFMANMSHEIRTPMNAIMGMSNQLAKTPLNQEQKFFLEVVHSASENLLVIINDILDSSKIEAGKLTLEHIGFDIRQVIAKAIRVTAHRAEEKGLLLRSQIDPEVADVLIGDPFRLSQILLNLLTNAIKFTAQGHVTVAVSPLASGPDKQRLHIEVSDSGSGMEQKFVAKLFDKFSQENEAITRKFGGTGLGMSICRDLAELMDGSIKAHSRKGQGTTITIDLVFPRGSAADLPVREEARFDSGFLEGCRILVVDDNELNRLVASTLLHGYGAVVIEAVNGRKAIEMVETQLPQLVLMDIQMPEMNGREATLALRKKGLTIPIIGLTAEVLQTERQKSIQEGMNDYLAKPFDEHELLRAIARCLGKRYESSVSGSVGTTVNQCLYDLSKLRAMSHGDNGFLHRLIGIFIAQTPLMVKEMRDSFERNDLKAMGALAHKMKPSIDNLGISRIREVVRTVERAGIQECADPGLSAAMEEIDCVVAEVVGQLLREESIEKAG